MVHINDPQVAMIDKIKARSASETNSFRLEWWLVDSLTGPPTVRPPVKPRGADDSRTY